MKDNIVKDSNINNIIGNKNKTNLANNTSTVNYYKYEIVDNKQNKICRPGLKDIGEGNIITFEAACVGRYNKLVIVLL